MKRLINYLRLLLNPWTEWDMKERFVRQIGLFGHKITSSGAFVQESIYVMAARYSRQNYLTGAIQTKVCVEREISRDEFLQEDNRSSETFPLI